MMPTIELAKCWIRRAASGLLGVPLVLGLTAPAAGQVEGLTDGWRWVQYTSATGLPAGRILDITESRGIPWIVTERGIAWFDGYTWRRPAGSDSAGAGAIRRVTADPRGGVLGLVDGSIIRVDTTGITREDVPMLPEGSPVTAVVAIGSDAMLLIANGGEQYRWADGALQIEALPEDSRPAAEAGNARFWRTRNGRVWLSAGPLYEWTGSGWIRRFASAPRILREDLNGGLLAVAPVGKSPDLWTWRREGQPEHAIASGRGGLVAADIDPEGDAIAVYTGGVRVRHAGAWNWVPTPPEPLERPNVLYYRANGDLWVGSGEELYLYRGSAKRWTSLDPPGGTGFSTHVNALMRTRTGELWEGTGDGLVIHRTDGRLERITEIDGTTLSEVTGLAEDSSGGVWVSSGSTFPGAFRLLDGRWRHYGVADGLRAERVHRIVPDRHGRLWFLGLSPTRLDEPGAFVWDGERFGRWGMSEGLPSGRVYAFAEGADGALWFGTLAGLSRYRAGRWTHWPRERDGPMGRVYAIAVDPAGQAWFGQRFDAAGLGTIDANDDARFTPVAEGVSANEVVELAFGANGALWIATNAGLGVMRRGTIGFLGRSAGLRNLSIWPVLVRPDTVYVGTMGDGVHALDLSEMDMPLPRVDVAPPLIDAREVLFRWNAHSYGGLQPSSNVQTRYQVDDAAWSPWSTGRQAAAVRMPPGGHTFAVEAKGLYGLSSTAQTVGFRIPPPFWLHPAFLTAAGVLALVLMALAAAYWRKQRLHRETLHGLNTALERDIEDRKRAEQALRESQRFSQHISESLPSILLVHELDSGRVAYVNREVERILGYSPDHILSLDSYADLAHEDGTDAMRAHGIALREAEDGEIIESEWMLRAESGDARVLAVRGTVFDRADDGVPYRVLIVAQDITDQKNLQAQFLQSQKMEMVGRLAGGVAHDFNNLLTAIVGYSDLAMDAVPSNGTAVEDIQEIKRAADRARALTAQLLAFGRKQVTEPRLLDLNDLVANMDRMLRRLIGGNIDLLTLPAPDIGVVRIDPAQFEQVLLNLVVNARDAMPGGGSVVISTARTIVEEDAADVGGVPRGDWVRVTVRDTGTGIPPHVVEHVFEPFFTTKEVGKGTGLGLSTCYGIIRQAGGHIRVATSVGNGTTFSVYLPRVDGARAARKRQATASGSLPSGTETILLVEDEPQVRKLASRVLRSAGYTVIEAADGNAALAMVQRDGPALDLLLTDLVMPGLSGGELWEKLRVSSEGLRVLLISGYTEDEAMHRDISLERLPFLAKPFTVAALAEKVRTVLDAPRRDQPSGASGNGGPEAP